MSQVDHQLETYFHLMGANGASRAYEVAVDTGLLDGMSDPASAATLAERFGLQERPVQLLLELLQALGLTREEGGVWSQTPLASRLLSGPYRKLGNPYWDHLESYLRKGVPLTRGDEPSASEAFYQQQALSLGWMLRPAATAAAKLLATQVPRKALSILDLGAGSAIWSLSLAAQHLGSQVTAVDWPMVLPAAEMTAQRFGMESRLHVVPGNFYEVTLPENGFDVVFIANVAHLVPEEALARLVKCARGWLTTAGRIVVIDAFPGQESGDVLRAVYTLGLALRSSGAVVHREEALRRILASAGFDAQRLDPLEEAPWILGMLSATPRIEGASAEGAGAG